eukprot:2183031-Prorocentrum_lima.AAC.1
MVFISAALHDRKFPEFCANVMRILKRSNFGNVRMVALWLDPSIHPPIGKPLRLSKLKFDVLCSNTLLGNARRSSPCGVFFGC